MATETTTNEPEVYGGHTRLTSADEMVGKTIAEAEIDELGAIAFRFTDQTFYFADIDLEGGDDPNVEFNTRAELRPMDAHCLGLIDRETCQRLDAERNAKHRTESEAADRAQYEKLKARFEATPIIAEPTP